MSPPANTASSPFPLVTMMLRGPSAALVSTLTLRLTHGVPSVVVQKSAAVGWLNVISAGLPWLTEYRVPETTPEPASKTLLVVPCFKATPTLPAVFPIPTASRLSEGVILRTSMLMPLVSCPAVTVTVPPLVGGGVFPPPPLPPLPELPPLLPQPVAKITKEIPTSATTT